MYYKCPDCPDPPGKYFTTKDKLNKHQKRVHPGEPQPGPSVENPSPDPSPTPTKKQFEIKKPEHKGKQEPQPQQPYHCQTCGADIQKGDNPCPNCGEPLNWEGVE